MKRLIALFCLALWATHALAQGPELNLKPYYKNLDYFNKSHRQEQLSYEAAFTAYLKHNLSRELHEFTEADAKNILYGTLFLTNTNQGVRFGQISYQEIIQYGKLSAQSELKSELMAREELILANLRIAQKLTPQDERIDAWIGTHEMYSEELKYGSATTETFEKMMNLGRRDVFSYTALAVISNELTLTPEQQKRMVELADLVSDGKIPCIKNAHGKCFEHRLAPQTNQVGKLITADIYLRDASQYVEGKEDVEGKRIQSGVSARVVYGMLGHKRSHSIMNWENIYLKARVKAVNNLLWNQKAVSPELTKSIKFKRAYSCIACHAGAKL
jgi:hypothetical protein